MKTKVAILNTASYLSAFVLNAVVVFVSSPYLVAALGVDKFGLWKVLQKLFDIVSVADGRAGQTLKMIIARLNHEGTIKEKTDAIGASILIWICFLPLSFLVILSIYFNLPVVLGKNYSVLDPVELGLVYAGFSALVLLAPILGIPDAVLMGTNQGYKSIVLQVAGMIMANAGIVVVAVFGFGMFSMCAVTIVATIFTSLSLIFVTKINCAWFSASLPKIHDFKSQAFKNISMNLWLLVEKVLISIDVIIIGSLVGSSEAASFSFVSYIPQLAMAVILVFGASITPSLASMFKINDCGYKDVVFVFREFVVFSASVMAVGCLLINDIFVSLWVGEKFLMSKEVMLLTSFSIIQISSIRSEAQLQDAVLAAKARIVYGMFGISLSVLLSFILFNFNVFQDPSVSVLFGALVGRVVLMFGFSRVTNTVCNVDFDPYMHWMKSLFFLFLSYFLHSILFDFGVFGRLFVSIFSLLFFVALMYFFILSSRSREYINLRLTVLIRK